MTYVTDWGLGLVWVMTNIDSPAVPGVKEWARYRAMHVKALDISCGNMAPMEGCEENRDDGRQGKRILPEPYEQA